MGFLAIRCSKVTMIWGNTDNNKMLTYQPDPPTCVVTMATVGYLFRMQITTNTNTATEVISLSTYQWNSLSCRRRQPLHVFLDLDCKWWLCRSFFTSKKPLQHCTIFYKTLISSNTESLASLIDTIAAFTRSASISKVLFLSVSWCVAVYLAERFASQKCGVC